jgi:hypothetical protein
VVSLWDLISLTLNWHFADLVNCAGFLPPGKKEEAAEKKPRQRLKEVAGPIAELNRRAAQLYDVRFRTMSLDPAWEKLAGNQPSIRKDWKAGCPLIASYCTTWFTTEDVLLSETASPKY